MNNILVFSFLQGVFAFFAPCAVALLPAYIISFISRNTEENSSKYHLLLRGLKLALFSILGILLIYLTATVFIILAAEIIKTYMKYIALGLGGLLIVMGFLILLGKDISLNIHLNTKEYKSEIKEAFFFGVAYAVAALGCLFPLFLVVASQTLSEPNRVLGISYIVAYFIGISLLMFLTIIGAIFTRDTINTRIKYILPYMHKITSVLLIGAGIYTIYYQMALF